MIDFKRRECVAFDRDAGFWIDPIGNVVPISEHFEEIRAHPKRFGYSQKIADKWTRADRDRIVAETVLRGWIRVRGHGNSTTFDVEELNGDAIHAITAFLQAAKAWPNEEIKVHEVRRKKVGYYEAGKFLDGAALQYARNSRRGARG